MTEQEKKEKKFTKNFEKFHDKNYKILLIIPAIFILIGIIYMGIFYSQNQDFIHKDISLKGGTSVTIQDKIDTNRLVSQLSDELGEINTKKVYDLTTREQTATVIETIADKERTEEVLENYLGYELTEENSSFEFTSSALSESFYRQILVAILFAFLFMSIVVFILFRTIVPSGAVIISAFADILMTLVVVNLLGMKLSTAGIIAFLMLIGYSVDTDIMLTNKVLKRKEGELNERMSTAFKTGITMAITSILAIGAALIIVSSFSQVLTQIFTVLIIGLGFDIFNTWITNASIIKWYSLKKTEK